MFCPEGYVTIASLVPKAKETFFDDAFESVCKLFESEEHTGEMEINFLKIAPLDVVERKMMEGLSEKIFLASPNGEILKFDMDPILGAVGLSGINLNELNRIQASEEYSDKRNELEEFIVSLRLFDEDLDTFFSDFRKSKTPSIWAFAKEARIDGKHFNAPLFFERNGYTITLKLFDFQRPFSETEEFFEAINFGGFQQILRPFEGWVICVKQREAKKWETRISKEKQDKILSIDRSSRPKKPGRPQMQEIALVAYKQLFPSGHAGFSWPKVTQKLEKEMGVVVLVLSRFSSGCQRRNKNRPLGGVKEGHLATG